MQNLFKERREKLDIFKAFRRQEITLVKKDDPRYQTKACEQCASKYTLYDLQHNLMVCPACGHHHRLHAAERIEQIVDSQSFTELFGSLELKQPTFPGYAKKLQDNQEQTALKDAVVCGKAKLDGNKIAIGVMDSYFMMGSMGSIVGEKLTRLIEYAQAKKRPLILFCCSGGARMQEGIISLFQMVKTSSALSKFQQAGGLYISVLTHPTTGGVSASFASLGDITLAEPKALIGFAGRRVIEKTIHETLPEEFQTAEFQLSHGFIDQIVPRQQLRQTLSEFIALHERSGQ